MTCPINILTALFLALMAGTDAGAGTYTVAMTPFLTFEPAYLQIQVGDTVLWTNEDELNQHDTTSTEGFWASPLLDYGQTYTLTFPITGTFPYEDSFFGESGMTGTVVALPSVAAPILVNPAWLRGQGFQFTVTNLQAGLTNIIQASTNLLAWSGIHTNIASSSGYTFLDAIAASSGRRFYRVLALPSPQ
jgi:plastocyanin